MNLSFPGRLLSETMASEPSTDGPILALETSGKSASVALLWPDGRMASLETDPTIGSAKTLAPAIAAILKSQDLNISELAAIAVTVGPGSFTGLRVGVATAKSMAYALNLPTIAVDTLETMAWETACVFDSESENPLSRSPFTVWTLLDAYRGELFAALWLMKPSEINTYCTAIVPSQLVNSAGWSEAMLSGNRSLCMAIPGHPGNLEQHPKVLVGPGLSRCPRLFDPIRPDFMIRNDIAPRATMVARIGRRKWIEHQTMNAFLLMPVYLRGSAAEEKLLKS